MGLEPRKVARIVEPQMVMEGAGVRLKRSIATRTLDYLDPFLLFDQLMQQEQSRNVDPNHAFYLGFEMAKASIALLLGKQYEQDESLKWGHLTEPEPKHRLKRRS